MAFTVRKGAYGIGTTSFLAAVPTAGDAPVAGDALYIIMESADSATAKGTPNTPTDWTKLFERAQVDTVTGVTTLTIFGKIAGASEADVTVDGVGNHCSGSMLVISGHGLANIAATVVGAGDGADTGNASASSITVTAGSCVVLVVGSTRDASATNTFSAWAATDPAAPTEIEDNVTNSASGGGIGYAHGICAGTTTGTGTATISVSAQHNEVFLGLAPSAATISFEVGMVPIF